MSSLGSAEYTCQTCRFFERFHDQAKDGRCRAGVPTIPYAPSNLHGIWPEVHEDDWCGHHAVRPVKQA